MSDFRRALLICVSAPGVADLAVPGADWSKAVAVIITYIALVAALAPWRGDGFALRGGDS